MSLKACAGMLVWVALVACNAHEPGNSIDQGYRSLAIGDVQSARASFEQALKRLSPADPQFLDARIGWVAAWIPSDPDRAVREVKALDKLVPGGLDEARFVDLAGRLTGAEHFPQALHVVDYGRNIVGADSSALTALRERVEREAKAAEPVLKLKSIGPYYELKN